MSRGIHVSVIGAGLGGLCLGQGLRRAGVRFTVFERDPSPESRGQGYRLRIDPDGQAALRQSLPAELNVLFRQSCAVASTTGRFFDTALREIAGRPVDTWRPSTTSANDGLDRMDCTANRQTLREILMCGIEPHIQFGKALDSFEHDPRGVSCRFEDGSIVRTDILVAADGASSLLRRATLPDAEPRDTGDVSIYGKTIMTSDVAALVGPLPADGISVVFSDEFAVIVDAIRFRAPLPRLAAELAPACSLSSVDHYFYWSFFGARSALALPPGRLRMGSPAEVSAHVEALTSTWHPSLKALFRLADPDALALRPVLSAPPLRITLHGPVAFLGDAIHVMSPAGGLGANSALRDAVELAAKIGSVEAGRSDVSEALRAYHADATVRADRAIALSEDGSRRLSDRTLLDGPTTMEPG